MSNNQAHEKEQKYEDRRRAYEEVCKSYHLIDDFRAKLLGFLPFASRTGMFFYLSLDDEKFHKYFTISQYRLGTALFSNSNDLTIAWS